MTCKLCRGYGQVHPRVNGIVLYDRTVWCKCQDKTGIASPPRSPARLAYMIDYFHEGLTTICRDREAPIDYPNRQGIYNRLRKLLKQ